MRKPKQQVSTHHIDEFLGVIPESQIKSILSKREYKKFEKFMNGQTIMLLERQAGIYYNDLLRFLSNINDTTLYD